MFCLYSLEFMTLKLFLFNSRSCCSSLVFRSWSRQWRPRLSVQLWTETTTPTGPSQTTRTCGCLEEDTSTRTSSARANTSNTISTVTCRANWVSVCVCVSPENLSDLVQSANFHIFTFYFIHIMNPSCPVSPHCIVSKMHKVCFKPQMKVTVAVPIKSQY